ncbi:MAG: CCA tRNA nucleotidyltransferase [Akkermansia sp.]|nr:CCA tRNA nucleotidyltransferase [Akkermansia sp.]
MIDIPQYAATVLERLEHHGFEAYVVGGCVRDSLMGRTPKDWDVCTNALPDEVLRVFRKFHVIKTGLKHGTVTVMVDHQPVEVTTFRIDGAYTDNRHPDSVNFVSRVEEDLARRDFTINAMAYNPRRGLVDAFGGREDLDARAIRCVGEPDERFHEDGLRILRALRFASRYDFNIETETAHSIRRNRHLLSNVSAERIFTELKGILAGEGVLSMLLGFPEVFATIIPEIQPAIGFPQKNPYHCFDVWTHTAYAVAAAPADEPLRLVMLLHDLGKPAHHSVGEDGRAHFYGHPETGAQMAKEILLRLKSDNATLERAVVLVREHDIVWPTTPAGMRRLIGRIGAENVRLLFDVRRADLAAHSEFAKEKDAGAIRAAYLLFEDVLDSTPAFTVKDLPVNGADLMALGMQPGPAMRCVLERLLAEMQEETLPAERDPMLARAREIIQATPKNS